MLHVWFVVCLIKTWLIDWLDDSQKQQRSKFDTHHAKIPYPVLTKIYTGDYVGGIFCHTKEIMIYLG